MPLTANAFTGGRVHRRPRVIRRRHRETTHRYAMIHRRVERRRRDCSAPNGSRQSWAQTARHNLARTVLRNWERYSRVHHMDCRHKNEASQSAASY